MRSVSKGRETAQLRFQITVWVDIYPPISEQKIKTSKNEGRFDLVEGKVNYHSTMEFENMK